MEDQIGSFLELFGISVEDFLTLSAIVWLFIELLKGKLGNLIKGWRSDVIALVVAGCLSAKMFYPEFEVIVVSAFLCWLAPAGVHKVVKKFSKEGSK